MRLQSTVLKALVASSALIAFQAQAAAIGSAHFTPTITDSVTEVTPGNFNYAFSIKNNSYYGGDDFYNGVIITRYWIPYFPDAGIENIEAPVGWEWRVDVSDRFSLGRGAQTLEWYVIDFLALEGYGIAGGDELGELGATNGQTLGGFSFDAIYAPVKAPFSSMDYSGFRADGDPALPGSPNATAAGLTTPLPFTPAEATVSEPSVLSLIVLALAGAGWTERRWRPRAGVSSFSRARSD